MALAEPTVDGAEHAGGVCLIADGGKACPVDGGSPSFKAYIRISLLGRLTFFLLWQRDSAGWGFAADFIMAGEYSPRTFRRPGRYSQMPGILHRTLSKEGIFFSVMSRGKDGHAGG